MSLALPWALVLFVPAAVAWWWLGRLGGGATMRAALLVLLVLAATQPQLVRDDGGSDVLLVLDRSQSMGEALRGHDEVMRLIGEGREHGDRLGVIAFGAQPTVLQGPQTTGLPRLDAGDVDAAGSDLDAALETAAALIGPGRSVRVVVASDGESTGPDPRRSTTRLALLGARIDVLPVDRPPGADAAIVEVSIPGSMRLGEAFIGTAVLTGDRPERRSWRVLCDGRVIAAGTVDLASGRPATIAFRHRPSALGLAAYVVELDDRDDRQPANNRARAWTRVAGGERVLVVGGDGTRGNLGAALESGGLDVAYRAAGPLRLADLLGSSALVLAEAPAGAIGHAGMQAIARWVEHLGGGLVMTGGRQGFGSGGWHRSPVEAVLPVTLEVRDEHRLLAVAMAIAIDRSGSMSMTMPDGRQKIQLAAEGAAAAIELLGPNDRIAVFAIDTAPHVVLPMTRVTQPRRLADEVLGMDSQGGGIYVYEALAAAGAELLRTDAGTRHLVLFADANDAEQPGDYINLLADYRRHGITVSVVGLGSDRDSDAAFLIDVANRGGGRIAFAEDANDLPRLFAQETVLVARNPWIDQAVHPRPQAGALAAILGRRDGPLLTAWPAVPGYNLSHPRPRAEVLAWCEGDPRAPAAAAWHIGGGRSLALPIPCEAADATDLIAWSGYGDLLASAVRWAAGAGDGAAPGALLATRRGATAEVRLELDPARESEWPARAPELLLIGDDPGRPMESVLMTPHDRGVWSAAVPLRTDRPLVPAVRLGSTTLLGGVLALPMPAESAPRRDLPPGSAVLAGLADATGGAVRGDVLGIWDNPPSRGVAIELAPWLVAAALVLLLAEIAVRRLRLDLRLGLPRLRWHRLRRRPAVAVASPPAGAPELPAVTIPPPPPAPAPTSTTLEALEELRRRR